MLYVKQFERPAQKPMRQPLASRQNPSNTSGSGSQGALQQIACKDGGIEHKVMAYKLSDPRTVDNGNPHMPSAT